MEPKVATKSFNEFSKEAVTHILKHPILYAVTIILFLAGNAVLSMAPKMVAEITKMAYGFLMIMFFMEITYSSTQEKYSVKKYIASIYATFLGIKSIILVNTSFAIKLSVLILVSAKIYFVMSVGVNPEVSNQNISLVVYLLYLFQNGFIDDFVVMCIWGTVLITDYYLLSRANGDYKSEWYVVANNGARKNAGLIWKMVLIAFFISMLSDFGFSFIVYPFMCAFLTFYGMDVYNMDSGKLARETQKEKERQEVENLIPQKM